MIKIGKHVMIGGGSLVMKDVPHFVKAARDPLSYEGVNSVGLKRRGFTTEQINRIHDIYRYLFIRHRNIKKALPEIALDFENTPEKDIILEFIQKSERGIMKGMRK